MYIYIAMKRIWKNVSDIGRRRRRGGATGNDMRGGKKGGKDSIINKHNRL